MRLWTPPKYDTTRELQDGDLGDVLSIDVFGHIDFAEQGLVIAEIVEDEFPEEGEYFEVEHLWRKEYPVEDFEDQARWEYGYTTKAIEGSIAVTRFQIGSYWSHLCVNHPDELSVIGMPASTFVEEDRHLAEDGYVYFCRPCADRVERRRQDAIAAAVAEQARRAESEALA